MKITINELIEKLKAIKIVRGNLEVIIKDENGNLSNIADIYGDGYQVILEEKRK